MGEPARSQLVTDVTVAYWRASRLLDPLRLQVWEDFRITFSQLRILFLVHHRPGRDLRSLAERLTIGTSAASQQVERLVDHGFLARREDVEDRRRIQLELTPRGEEAVAAVSSASNDYLNALFERFTDGQLQTLNEGLTVLLEAAAAVPAPQFALESGAAPAAIP